MKQVRPNYACLLSQSSIPSASPGAQLPGAKLNEGVFIRLTESSMLCSACALTAIERTQKRRKRAPCH